LCADGPKGHPRSCPFYPIKLATMWGS
jgi:hypothetical protein